MITLAQHLTQGRLIWNLFWMTHSENFQYWMSSYQTDFHMLWRHFSIGSIAYTLLTKSLYGCGVNINGIICLCCTTNESNIIHSLPSRSNFFLFHHINLCHKSFHLEMGFHYLQPSHYVIIEVFFPRYIVWLLFFFKLRYVLQYLILVFIWIIKKSFVNLHIFKS